MKQRKKVKFSEVLEHTMYGSFFYKGKQYKKIKPLKITKRNGSEHRNAICLYDMSLAHIKEDAIVELLNVDDFLKPPTYTE